ncbi:hypothetical protein [Sphingosinicella terrae]|uniref:hypothetical protein n=1 Tax=Sphingosinicella terrae TaxID=2172047 RepID=UPI0013B387BB|nr:hypothetical protein [Sphingosinicella terrae]
MGQFHLPTATRLERHILVAEKGDGYDIADGLPQEPWRRLATRALLVYSVAG